MSNTATNLPAIGDNSNNPSPFAKAMSDVFSLNAKVEGVSAKLIQAMYEMEVTFDFSWCEHYVKANGKAKTEMLDKTLNDLVPSYEELKSSCNIKASDYTNPNDRVRMAAQRDDARRKMKTAQNTLRQCCLALAFLRIGQAKTDEKNANQLIFKTPIVKIDVKNGKIRCADKDGWIALTYFSVQDIVRFGQNVIDQIGWKANVPGTPRVPGSSVIKTAEKAKATNGQFIGATKELSSALSTVVKQADYEKLAESDLESLRNLELTLLRKVYGDANGFIDVEALVEMCEHYNKDVKPEKDANKDKKAA